MSLTASGDRGEYAFACPGCSALVSKPASRRTASLLIAAGVMPAQMDDPAPPPALAPEDLSPDPLAPPLTLDDLLAFHFLLEDDIGVAEEFSLDG